MCIRDRYNTFVSNGRSYRYIGQFVSSRYCFDFGADESGTPCMAYYGFGQDVYKRQEVHLENQGGNAMRLNDNNSFIGINPPYQLSVIHSSKLIYPREIYQRGVERKRVELIARDFNEYIVNEPKVSFRNGRYYVMDGQHTIEGCILLNGGADRPILCKVYTGLTMEQEALLFAEQNGHAAPCLLYTSWPRFIAHPRKKAIRLQASNSSTGR